MYYVYSDQYVHSYVEQYHCEHYNGEFINVQVHNIST